MEHGSRGPLVRQQTGLSGWLAPTIRRRTKHHGSASGAAMLQELSVLDWAAHKSEPAFVSAFGRRVR